MKLPKLFGRKINSEVIKIINPCIICGYLTMGEKGMFDICPVCFWEDDGTDSNPDEVVGGPNGELSINVAKRNFAKMGAIEVRLLAYTRPPKDDELVSGLPPTEHVESIQETARRIHGIKKDSNPIYQ